MTLQYIILQLIILLKWIEKNAKGEVKAVVTDKRKLRADIVILGIGIRPNSGLAKKAGLKLGEKDAVLIDKTMKTSDEFIWAAGDCATSYHLLKKQNTIQNLPS